MIVVHEVTATTATLWCLVFDIDFETGCSDDDSSRFHVTVDATNAESFHPIVATPVFYTLGASNLPGFSFKVARATHTFSDLPPNTHFRVTIRRGSGAAVFSEASFETLPTSLTSFEWGIDKERPFTLFFGSCFSPNHDSGRAADSFKKLYEHPMLRPHIKFLLGDQVYLDRPFESLSDITRSSGELDEDFRARIFERYFESWTKLSEMLSRGGTWFLADDHEFWNDYPFTPLPFVWPAFSDSDVRTAWKRAAQNAFLEFQCVGHTDTADPALLGRKVDIGNELSFFLLDCRLGRTASSARFTTPGAIDRIRTWIESLEVPGVLALAQPLVSLASSTTPILGEAVGLVDDEAAISDHNLPYFDQYGELIDIFSRSRHDLVVLSGDVHFSRIARTSLQRRDSGGRAITLHEIVSSPLSLLTFDGPTDFFKPSARHEPSKQAPSTFPSPLMVPSVLPSEISFVRAGSAKKGDDSRTAENGISLSFRRSESGKGIVMKATCWLLRRRPGVNSIPVVDFDYETHLM